MKLTTLSLLSMCMAYVHGECENWPIADDGCDNTEYFEKIICTGGSCNCNVFEDEAGECASISANDMTALTPDALNGARCEQICFDSGDCVFFRWDKDGSANSNSHCTLMDATQCRAYMRCDKGICVSGQAGCNGDGTHPPIPDTAVCKSGVTFVPGSVHWHCYNGEDIINIYDETEVVPSGTICKTAHKCAAFDNDDIPDVPGGSYTNQFFVQCNPELSPTDIVWGKYGPSSNLPGKTVDEAMDEDHTSLKDPPCKTTPADLILEADIINEPGVELVCENDFKTDMVTKKVTVKAANVCVLLCNFQHNFSFESDLAEDGTGVWNKYDIGSDVPVVLNPDGSEIKCWDFMKR